MIAGMSCDQVVDDSDLVADSAASLLKSEPQAVPGRGRIISPPDRVPRWSTRKLT